MRRTLRDLARHLLNEHASPARLGAAVALGVFVGCLPLYGLHLAICVALAWLLGLNKVTVYLAANISNPLFAPFLVATGLALGQWIRFGELRGLDVEAGRDFVDQVSLWSGKVPDLFLSCLLGSAVLGLALAAVSGPLTWRWLLWRARRRQAGGGNQLP